MRPMWRSLVGGWNRTMRVGCIRVSAVIVVCQEDDDAHDGFLFSLLN